MIDFIKDNFFLGMLIILAVLFVLSLLYGENFTLIN